MISGKFEKKKGRSRDADFCVPACHIEELRDKLSLSPVPLAAAGERASRFLGDAPHRRALSVKDAPRHAVAASVTEDGKVRPSGIN